MNAIFQRVNKMKNLDLSVIKNFPTIPSIELIIKEYKKEGTHWVMTGSWEIFNSWNEIVDWLLECFNKELTDYRLENNFDFESNEDMLSDFGSAEVEEFINSINWELERRIK